MVSLQEADWEYILREASAEALEPDAVEPVSPGPENADHAPIDELIVSRAFARETQAKTPSQIVHQERSFACIGRGRVRAVTSVLADLSDTDVIFARIEHKKKRGRNRFRPRLRLTNHGAPAGQPTIAWPGRRTQRNTGTCSD